jgi:hypothetical protein
MKSVLSLVFDVIGYEYLSISASKYFNIFFLLFSLIVCYRNHKQETTTPDELLEENAGANIKISKQTKDGRDERRQSFFILEFNQIDKTTTMIIKCENRQFAL